METSLESSSSSSGIIIYISKEFFRAIHTVGLFSNRNIKPIVKYIKKHKETHGYKLTTSATSVINVITTPFADDFNIITHNKTMHQALVTDVENKLKSMGLVIKPKKCRSLSIQGGKTVNIPFRLKDKETGEDVIIDSVIEKPMKFQGQTVQMQCLQVYTQNLKESWKT